MARSHGVDVARCYGVEVTISHLRSCGYMPLGYMWQSATGKIADRCMGVDVIISHWVPVVSCH